MRGNDDIVQENQRLQKELRQLRARVHAVESSRWFRLHPRLALQRLRQRGSDGDDDRVGLEARDGIHELPIDFDERDAELCRRVAPYTMTTPPRIYALVRAVEYIVSRPNTGA